MSTHKVFKEGRRQLALGNIQGCIDRVTRAMKAGKVSARQLLTRAVARMQLGQYQESLVDCDRAMRIDPENKHLYFVRGSVFRRMERLADAIANLDQAIDINPEYGVAYLERAFCHTMAGNFTEAEQDFKMALKCTEISLQEFCDSVGVVRTQMDAVEALLGGERAYPHLLLPPEEFAAMQHTHCV